MKHFLFANKILAFEKIVTLLAFSIFPVTFDIFDILRYYLHH
jgi:hypothetical protein